MINQWMAHYNEIRPHSSLGYMTPNEFVEQLAPKGKSGEAIANMAVARRNRAGQTHEVINDSQ